MAVTLVALLVRVQPLVVLVAVEDQPQILLAQIHLPTAALVRRQQSLVLLPILQAVDQVAALFLLALAALVAAVEAEMQDNFSQALPIQAAVVVALTQLVKTLATMVALAWLSSHTQIHTVCLKLQLAHQQLKLKTDSA
jgi:hypothetical protein